MSEKSWLEVKNTSNTASEIYIMGDIVDEQWDKTDVTPAWFLDEMTKLNKVKNVHLFVNSSGGSVNAGLAIHDIIKNSKAWVVSHIMGIAASTASWMIMPSNKIHAPKNSLFYMHLPSNIVAGNKNDFLSNIKFLDKVEKIIAESYSRDGEKVTTEQAIEMMTNETLLDGQEAFDLGFVDVVEPVVKMENKAGSLVVNGIKHNINKFKNFPVIKTIDESATDLTEYYERINIARNKLLNLQRGN